MLSKNLKTMVHSSNPSQRLAAVSIMRQEARSLTPEYLELARTLVADPDNDCRWQALILIGEYIKTNPDEVWAVVCEFGSSPDVDMRDGIATILLEHLLEHHIDTYLPKLRELLETGNRFLADTLRRCWPFGVASGRWAEVEELARKYSVID